MLVMWGDWGGEGKRERERERERERDAASRYVSRRCLFMHVIAHHGRGKKLQQIVNRSTGKPRPAVI